MNAFYQHRFTPLLRWRVGQPLPVPPGGQGWVAPSKEEGEAEPASGATPGPHAGRASLSRRAVRVVLGTLLFCFAALAVLVPLLVAGAMLVRGARLLHVGEVVGGLILFLCAAGLLRPRRRPGSLAPPPR